MLGEKKSKKLHQIQKCFYVWNSTFLFWFPENKKCWSNFFSCLSVWTWNWALQLYQTKQYLKYPTIPEFQDKVLRNEVNASWCAINSNNIVANIGNVAIQVEEVWNEWWATTSSSCQRWRNPALHTI